MKFLRFLLAICTILFCNCSTPNQPTQQDTVVAKPSATMQSNTEQQTITCKEVAYQVLTSSKRFKELTKNLYAAVVKNGGTSYGIELEGSPLPEQDSAMEFSKTYDFAVHETYPDRDVTIARFSFNTIDKQLYEYDAVNDSLMLVDFDKTLLSKLSNGCK